MVSQPRQRPVISHDSELFAVQVRLEKLDAKYDGHKFFLIGRVFLLAFGEFPTPKHDWAEMLLCVALRDPTTNADVACVGHERERLVKVWQCECSICTSTLCRGEHSFQLVESLLLLVAPVRCCFVVPLGVRDAFHGLMQWSCYSRIVFHELA